MSEKTIIFPEGASGSSVDPNLLLTSMNGGGGFGGGMWNNPIWAIVFLAFLRGGLWGGDNGCCNGNAAFVSSQLGQAIAGNANAISNLSTSLNCTESQIQNAISNLQNSVQQVANANNMNFMQVVNAVQSGNSGILNQLQTCCCNITNAVNTGFGNLRYENAAQTCSVKQSIAEQTSSVLAKLDAIEDSRKDREIAALTAQLTAANSRAERQAELAPIYKAIERIPNTVPVQWPQLTAIPTSQLYGLGYGINPTGSIWS